LKSVELFPDMRCWYECITRPACNMFALYTVCRDNATVILDRTHKTQTSSPANLVFSCHI